MCNQWLIDGKSLDNQWVIERINYSSLTSMSNRCHWLIIDRPQNSRPSISPHRLPIDYHEQSITNQLITQWLLIDYLWVVISSKTDRRRTPKRTQQITQSKCILNLLSTWLVSRIMTLFNRLTVLRTWILLPTAGNQATRKTTITKTSIILQWGHSNRDT